MKLLKLRRQIRRYSRASLLNCSLRRAMGSSRSDAYGQRTGNASTPGQPLEDLRARVKDAVDRYFAETMEAPKFIRLHFVRHEVLAR